jgi:hypothetical protein
MYYDHFNTLWPVALFYGYLVYVIAIFMHSIPHLGILYEEKSGNPE